MKEVDVLVAIRTGNLSLAPVEFGDMREVDSGSADALLRARWNGREWQFAVEVKARSTPKTLREAVQTIQAAASPPRTYPLVVVPYLNADQVDALAAEKVSAVDLSGNGVLVVPGQIFVLRTGKPNRYPEKSVLKNVYRGKSSLALVCFSSEIDTMPSARSGTRSFPVEGSLHSPPYLRSWGDWRTIFSFPGTAAAFDSSSRKSS